MSRKRIAPVVSASGGVSPEIGTAIGDTLLLESVRSAASAVAMLPAVPTAPAGGECAGFAVATKTDAYSLCFSGDIVSVAMPSRVTSLGCGAAVPDLDRSAWSCPTAGAEFAAVVGITAADS